MIDVDWVGSTAVVVYRCVSRGVFMAFASADDAVIDVIRLYFLQSG